MGWLAGWGARKTITLPAIASQQTNINVYVSVSYSPLMKSDFSDIRFTDEDGTTLLYHWKETYIANTSALFILKIPTYPASGKTIQMYFSNPSASDASDGLNTFPLFDDFATLDLTKWQILGSNQNYVYVQDGKVILYAQWDYLYPTLASFQTFGVNYIGAMCINAMNAYSETKYVSFGKMSSYYISYRSTGRGSNDAYWGLNYHASNIYDYNWHRIWIHRKGLINGVYRDDGYFDGTKEASFDRNRSTTLDFRIGIYATGAGALFSADWAYVAKVVPQQDLQILQPSEQITFGKVNTKSCIIAYRPAVAQMKAWGEASVVGVNDEVKTLSLGPIMQLREVFPDPCIGWKWARYYCYGRKRVEPILEARLKYASRLWSLIAQLMGQDQVSGTGPYTHTLTLADSIDGQRLYGTLIACIDPKSVAQIFEWPSIKPIEVELYGPDRDGFVSVAIRAIADRIDLNMSAENTQSEIQSVTHIQLASDMPPFVPFGALRFRMNDYTGTELSDNDIWKIKGFRFRFRRKFAPDYITRGESNRAWEVDEPIEEGLPETTLQVTLADIDVSKIEKHQDGNPKKADLLFDYNGTYKILIEIPCLFPEPTQLAKTQSSRNQMELSWWASEAIAQPAGMNFVNWRITIVDDYSSSYTE